MTQEVFTTAWAAVDRFQGRASIRTWLHRIARNKFIDAHRRRKRHQRGTEELSERAMAAATDPASELILAEHSALVRQALKVLKVDDQTVLVLHYVAGLSYREMAEILDQPTGTIKWSTSRALDRLRQQLVGKVEP